MATDEQKALCYVLLALRQRGEEWLRRGAPGAVAAISSARAKFDAVTSFELESLLMHRSGEGQFEDSKVIFLVPPAKETNAVAALWCRWNFDKDLPACGLYFGIWSAQPPFPRDPDSHNPQRHTAFVGYRFETPDPNDNHNYYHVQPCRSMGRKDDEVAQALPISNRMPTWPIAADCVLELLLCLVISIYGMQGLQELKDALSGDPTARQSRHLRDAFDSVLSLTRPR